MGHWEVWADGATKSQGGVCVCVESFREGNETLPNHRRLAAPLRIRVQRRKAGHRWRTEGCSSRPVTALVTADVGAPWICPTLWRAAGTPCFPCTTSAPPDKLKLIFSLLSLGKPLRLAQGNQQSTQGSLPVSSSSGAGLPAGVEFLWDDWHFSSQGCFRELVFQQTLGVLTAANW